jgi:hypothetical protein
MSGVKGGVEETIAKADFLVGTSDTGGITTTTDGPLAPQLIAKRRHIGASSFTRNKPVKSLLGALYLVATTVSL